MTHQLLKEPYSKYNNYLQEINIEEVDKEIDIAEKEHNKSKLLELKVIKRDLLNAGLCRACKEGWLEQVYSYINAGADIDLYRGRALRRAATNGHFEIVKYLVKLNADVTKFNHGALRWAARNGHLEIVKYLFEHGSDVNAKNYYALKYSARKGYLDIVKFLLWHGSEMNMMNDYKVTLSVNGTHLKLLEYSVADESKEKMFRLVNRAIAFAESAGQKKVYEYLKNIIEKEK